MTTFLVLFLFGKGEEEDYVMGTIVCSVMVFWSVKGVAKVVEGNDVSSGTKCCHV